ncbi:hypothetical protein GCM10011506_43480 [Marivirga lumbricoides]|uniref:Uncharacterized protein n=1 Tax=Marivirga lumbricoides TaxID=1046115 RepID=A0ABQ1N7F4_9BACT|nr:hypothetical protein GCM10011506_43480 [Marivirga lumbricoides]
MKILKLTFLSCLIIAVFACSSTEEETIPDNVIIDSEGLIIDLEWSTGGSATQATTDADLDLFLTNGTKDLKSSVGSSFEQVDIEDIYSDGSYTITVEYYRGSKAVDYTLYLRGGSSSESIKYTGTFRSDDAGLSVTYLEIAKVGDRYTIIDL